MLVFFAASAGLHIAYLGVISLHVCFCRQKKDEKKQKKQKEREAILREQ